MSGKYKIHAWKAISQVTLPSCPPPQTRRPLMKDVRGPDLYSEKSSNALIFLRIPDFGARLAEPDNTIKTAVKNAEGA
jgi:hypothetical protein